MNLNNVRVLVDGYNLELQQGTGVKTYGVSLVQALKELQAQISILYSISLKTNKNQAKELTEALFFDLNSRYVNNYLRTIYFFKTINSYSFKTLTSIPIQTKQLHLSNSVIRDSQDVVGSELLQYAKVFNLPLCYQLANLIFNNFNIEQKIKAPEKIDIWHATYPLPISVKGAKKITTIHDLIPLRLPYTTLDDKDFFYRLVKKAIKTSDLIITVSENTRKDLIEIYNCPQEKIEITYQPIAIDRSSQQEDRLGIYLRKYNLKYQQYILFVGAIEPKKNLGRLIDAYAMSSSTMPLVIVGKKGWLWEKDLAKIDFLFKSDTKDSDKKKSESKKAIVLDYIAREDLKYLYQGAYCLVFPSLYEGFGLPPLEAMTFGCPVITSNVSSLPEVCGDAALYIDPYYTDSLADTLERLTSDRSLRENLSQAGKIRADLFSQENYIKRLSLAYQKVLSSSKK